MEDMGRKILTDLEVIDIIKRAPDEIECADAYQYFLEDLAALVAKHFGGEVDMVSGPEYEAEYKRYVCDSCGKVYEDEVEFIQLVDCNHLTERLTPGSPVPNGECGECGAFVYEDPEIDTMWIVGMQHNSVVPDDGWVYSRYDTDIDWKRKQETT